MKVRVFGCRKYRMLWHEQADRDLSPTEHGFMLRHREVCDECQQMEETASRALNMLRAASLDPFSAPHFEDRVIRRLRIRTVRESIGYWSPAFVGAGIACLALFAALQIVATPSHTKPFDLPQGQARRDIVETLPSLELREVPQIQ